MDKILIVDDDSTILKNLDILLSDAYIHYCASNFQTAISILEKQNIQLCLIDINLQDQNGFALCRTIRTNYTMPIIILTVNDDEESLEKGIISGADDYMTKPFSIKELCLRIMAQLRRNAYARAKQTYIKTSMWQLNLSRHTFSYNTIEIQLSKTEYSIIEILMKNSGCLVTRETLLDNIFESNDSFVENNTLSVYMSRLRSKIHKHCGTCPIETIRGIGYRWKESML